MLRHLIHVLHSSEMEAIAALSLASNILQFVDSGLKVTSKCKEIYSSADGVTARTATIDEIVSQTDAALKSLQGSLSTSDSDLQQEDEELKALGEKASQAIKKLRDLIKKLTVRGLKPRKRDSVAKTLKSMWYQDELEKIFRELKEYRNVLNTRLIVDLQCVFQSMMVL